MCLDTYTRHESMVSVSSSPNITIHACLPSSSLTHFNLIHHKSLQYPIATIAGHLSLPVSPHTKALRGKIVWLLFSSSPHHFTIIHNKSITYPITTITDLLYFPLLPQTTYLRGKMIRTLKAYSGFWKTCASRGVLHSRIHFSTSSLSLFPSTNSYSVAVLHNYGV